MRHSFAAGMAGSFAPEDDRPARLTLPDVWQVMVARLAPLPFGKRHYDALTGITDTKEGF